MAVPGNDSRLLNATLDRLEIPALSRSAGMVLVGLADLGIEATAGRVCGVCGDPDGRRPLGAGRGPVLFQREQIMVSRPDCRRPGERQRWNLVCGASAERFGIRLGPKQSEAIRPKQCGIQHLRGRSGSPRPSGVSAASAGGAGGLSAAGSAPAGSSRGGGVSLLRPNSNPCSVTSCACNRGINLRRPSRSAACLPLPWQATPPKSSPSAVACAPPTARRPSRLPQRPLSALLPHPHARRPSLHPPLALAPAPRLLNAYHLRSESAFTFIRLPPFFRRCGKAATSALYVLHPLRWR